MPEFKGRTALIFGGKSGIGAAVRDLFERSGIRVCVADRFEADELSSSETAIRIACDVTNAQAVRLVVDRALETLGHIDILVNNAGTGTPALDFHEVPLQEWRRVFDVNLDGTLHAIQAVLPHMLQRGFGRIINTASQLAHKPAPQQAAYCASKAALVALSVSLAQEVASQGITVNCVCPGPTDTPMWHASDPAWKEWKISQLPIRRIGTVEEVASAYLYLASDEAAFIVGQSLSPNGGDVMW
ncbi:NAD(P)-dependent dehydrogenase (short-subunit alcohol dehydrogenase family) [Rhizobium petrolearium]|jgi:NAD(P)-dependent dehydrogenase (short-subunit alcohol dehydrogenase family)|uniref:SDR family NAD(P)-dependent oxidoreductase n=1 Tax=Neorhizobium petrolearium TaxID=515361 RepID=UPI001AE76CDC|nr:SDR family NAD(P)-dependent oxidoreductase [Neorhizobium petrolearium]MBP1847598.1 NAD(P)-dependent dehydrogenase (short-subunit alcohol dehydrogenase family) [Neorhizobium petrolearium]